MKLPLMAAIIGCMLLTAWLVLQRRPAGFERVGAKAAKALMDSESDCLILDVRDGEEYASGHIPGAVSRPLAQILSGEAKLPPEKERLILVYCLTGRRSGRACAALTKRGYTRVKNIGGIMSWPYDVEKGSG